MTQPAKHTPGPWKAERNYAEVAVNERINIIADDILIAETHHAWMDWEEQEANANLIAAAPAMYEALKTTLAYFMRSNQSHAPELRVIRAALAQADGKHD